MRALTWQGKEDVRVEDVPDPQIADPTDAIIKLTSTAICGSDLRVYSPLGAFVDPGYVLGHEPMGIVQERRARGHPQPPGGAPGRGVVRHRHRDPGASSRGLGRDR